MTEIYVPKWLRQTFERARAGLCATPAENRPHWLRDMPETRDQAKALERVKALCGGPFADGYQPYAVDIGGEVVLAVLLDDLRAAIDGPERA